MKTRLDCLDIVVIGLFAAIILTLLLAREIHSNNSDNNSIRKRTMARPRVRIMVAFNLGPASPDSRRAARATARSTRLFPIQMFTRNLASATVSQ